MRIVAALTLDRDEEHRTVLLVFSDGRDTASWLSERNILDVVRRAKPTIHAIEIPEPRDTTPPIALPPGRSPNAPVSFLNPHRFSRRSPGRPADATGAPPKPEELGGVFRAAPDEMRTRYELTFYPTTPSKPGWHRLKVRLKRGSATIPSRPGYFVDSSHD